jgi:hypothetical protein
MDRDHDFEHESAIGEIEEIVEGLIERFRVRPLQGRHRSPPVMAAFSFGYGCISIGIMSTAALLTSRLARRRSFASIRPRCRAPRPATPSSATQSA